MAFSSAWKVAVQFNFQSQGTIQNINNINQATNQAANNMQRFGKVSQMTALLVGSAMMGAGRAVLGFVADSVKSAADLQSAMAVLTVKEGATTPQARASLAALLPQMAHETGRLSQIDAARLMGSLLGTGFTTQQLASGGAGHTLAELFAKFGDALALGTAGGEHPETVAGAATAGASIMHQFGFYDPKVIAEKLESFNQIAQAMGLPMASLQRQTAYFAADVKAHKMGWDDVVGILNVLGPMGLMQSKGGTGIDQVIRLMTAAPNVTRSLQLGRNQADLLLGLTDGHNNLRYMEKDGHFDMMPALAQLRKDEATMKPETFMKLINAAFPSANGLRTILALIDPDRFAQANLLKQKEGGVKRIDEIQALYLAQLSGAWQQLTTDFESMKSVLTPSFTGMLTAFVQGLDRLVISAHDLFVNIPWTATAATLALVATGAGLLTAGFGLVFSTLGVGVGVLAALVNPFTLVVSAVAAVGLSVWGLGQLFRSFLSNPQQFGKNLADFVYGTLPSLLSTVGATIQRTAATVFMGIGRLLEDLFGYSLYKLGHPGSSFYDYTKTADPGLHKVMTPIVYAANQALAAAAREHARIVARQEQDARNALAHNLPAIRVASANTMNAAAWDKQNREWSVAFQHGSQAAASFVESFSRITNEQAFGNPGSIYQAAVATNKAFVDVMQASGKLFHSSLATINTTGQGPTWHVAPPHREKQHGAPSPGTGTTVQQTITGETHIHVHGAQSPAVTAAEIQRKQDDLRRRQAAMVPAGSH